MQSTHIMFLISLSKNQNFLEKWLILGLRQEISKMSLEHHKVPESEEAHTQKKN